MINQPTKFPRIPHLPWSNISDSEDISQSGNIKRIYTEPVVVTEKMDGENITMYSDYIHARSLEKLSGVDYGRTLSFHNSIRNNIPEYVRLCFEDVTWAHSIRYTNLESYLYLIGVFMEDIVCSWARVCRFAEKFGVPTPKVLYSGIISEKNLRALDINSETTEGYVVRVSSEFHISNWVECVAKYVRPSHVSTDKHWKYSKKEPNTCQSVKS